MPDSSNFFPWTELDKQSFSGPIQMLKATVPYVSPENGQKLAMFVRLLELRHTMNIFNEEQISICSVSGNKHPEIEDVLRDIKKYCAPAEAEQIDQLLNMLMTIRLYNQYNELTKNTDLSNMMNQLNSIKKMNMNSLNISPEQIQMIQSMLHAQSTISEKES